MLKLASVVLFLTSASLGACHSNKPAAQTTVQTRTTTQNDMGDKKTVDTTTVDTTNRDGTKTIDSTQSEHTNVPASPPPRP